MRYAVGYLYRTTGNLTRVSPRRHILIVQYSDEGIDYHRGRTLCGRKGAVRSGWVYSLRSIARHKLVEGPNLCLRCERSAEV